MEDLTKLVENELKDYPKIIERNFTLFTKQRVENDDIIRIMQWNILARALGNKEESSQTPLQVYEWNFKKWRTIQEILRHNSDIICLEEVDFYEDIKPFLHNLGYTSVFCPKFSSPCLKMEPNYGPDGCAIFYRLSMFQINNMSCEKIMIDNNIHPQVFIILQLKHISTKKLLTIVCLHLKSKVENFKRREVQIEFILKKVKEHLNGASLDVKEHAIFLCGDFNGEPFEKFYELIIKDEQMSNLVDAYTIDAAKEPTTIKKRNSKMIRRGIDYIFYNKKTASLIGYLELPKNNKLLNEQGLPNLEFSSDHLSLVCDFKLN